MTSKIFLLGEGDFSFSHSLSNHSQHTLFPIPFSTIIASSLDSREEVLKKYPHFTNLTFSSSVSIFHNVNAIDVSSWPSAVSDDFTVMWNHPHCGRENAIEHYQLLCHFFHALQLRFHRVIISLIEGQFERWNVEEAGRKFGWFAQCSPIVFDPSDFPQYQGRRNLSGSSFKTTSTSEETKKSWFYVFGRTEVVVDLTMTKMNVSKSIFPCSTCGKTFTSDQGLKTHVRQVHELAKYADVALRMCDECGDQFRGSEALYNHKNGVHAYRNEIATSIQTVGETIPYLCDVCNSSDPDHLVKFGTNEELESCKDCGRKFRNKRALIQHSASVHSS